VTYSVEGTQASGSPTTTFFNTLLNILLTAFATTHMLTPEATSRLLTERAFGKFSVCGCGDDNMTAHAHGYPVDWTVFTKCGLRIKLKENRKAYQLEYCSGLFYPAEGERYVWAPKIGKFLFKTGFSFSEEVVRSKSRAHFYSGVLNGVKEDFAHVPCMAEWIRAVCTAFPNKVIRSGDYKHKMHTSRSHVADIGRYNSMVLHRYGFIPQLPIGQVQKLPLILREPWLHRLMEVDC